MSMYDNLDAGELRVGISDAHSTPLTPLRVGSLYPPSSLMNHTLYHFFYAPLSFHILA